MMRHPEAHAEAALDTEVHRWQRDTAAEADGLLDPGQPTETAHLAERARKMRVPAYRRWVQQARDEATLRAMFDDTGEAT